MIDDQPLVPMPRITGRKEHDRSKADDNVVFVTRAKPEAGFYPIIYQPCKCCQVRDAETQNAKESRTMMQEEKNARSIANAPTKTKVTQTKTR